MSGAELFGHYVSGKVYNNYDEEDAMAEEARLRREKEELHARLEKVEEALNIVDGKILRVGSHVIIKAYDKNDPNHKGRVTAVGEDGVYVSNTNMPYMGTFSMKFFHFDEVIVNE